MVRRYDVQHQHCYLSLCQQAVPASHSGRMVAHLSECMPWGKKCFLQQIYKKKIWCLMKIIFRLSVQTPRQRLITIITDIDAKILESAAHIPQNVWWPRKHHVRSHSIALLSLLEVQYVHAQIKPMHTWWVLCENHLAGQVLLSSGCTDSICYFCSLMGWILCFLHTSRCDNQPIADPSKKCNTGGSYTGQSILNAAKPLKCNHPRRRMSLSQYEGAKSDRMKRLLCCSVFCLDWTFCQTQSLWDAVCQSFRQHLLDVKDVSAESCGKASVCLSHSAFIASLDNLSVSTSLPLEIFWLT